MEALRRSLGEAGPRRKTETRGTPKKSAPRKDARLQRRPDFAYWNIPTMTEAMMLAAAVVSTRSLSTRV